MRSVAHTGSDQALSEPTLHNLSGSTKKTFSSNKKGDLLEAQVISLGVFLLVEMAQVASAQVDSVTVNMSLYGGSPTYRASGFIYGISQDVSTPAANLQSEIKTQIKRAGGSQIGCPNGGWINGQYTPRWHFVQSYYARAKSVGSNYVMILAALWGADGVCNVPSFPGDNGSFTQYLSFLNQVISDVKAAGMTGTDVQ